MPSHDRPAPGPDHHSMAGHSSQGMPVLITADEDLRATISAAAYEAGLGVQTSRDPVTALQR